MRLNKVITKPPLHKSLFKKDPVKYMQLSQKYLSPIQNLYVQKLCTYMKGMAVVSLGCGSGINLEKYAGVATCVVGVDNDERMLSEASRKTECLENTTLVNSDFLSPSFNLDQHKPKNGFDCVELIRAGHLIPSDKWIDLQRVIDSLLSPGGHILWVETFWENARIGNPEGRMKPLNLDSIPTPPNHGICNDLDDFRKGSGHLRFYEIIDTQVFIAKLTGEGQELITSGGKEAINPENHIQFPFKLYVFKKPS